MKYVQEVIIVEGRYDKSTVSQAVNATILETSGFGIINDKDKIALLRRLAEKRGLIILTDSDKAGFLIRGKLKGMLSGLNIKHAYIPDIEGKEKRKTAPSKENKLGVEAMTKETIIKALELAGATFSASLQTPSPKASLTSPPSTSALRADITKADLFDKGLSGGTLSSNKRRALLKELDLPINLSSNALLDVLNALYSRDEFLSGLNK